MLDEQKIGPVLEKQKTGTSKTDVEMQLLLLLEVSEDVGKLISIIPPEMQTSLKTMIQELVEVGHVRTGSASGLLKGNLDILQKQRENIVRLRTVTLPALKTWVAGGMKLPVQNSPPLPAPAQAPAQEPSPLPAPAQEPVPEA